MKIHCKHCNRYLFTATGNVMIDQMPCPGCGAKSNFNIVFAVDTMSAERATEEPPKAKRPKE